MSDGGAPSMPRWRSSATFLTSSATPQDTGLEAARRDGENEVSSHGAWWQPCPTQNPSGGDQTHFGKNFPVCAPSFSLGLPSHWDYSSETGAFSTGASLELHLAPHDVSA